jgi:hypothetical protein
VDNNLAYCYSPLKWIQLCLINFDAFPTRQTSTSKINRMYFTVLLQQIVDLLISSQDKILRRCLVDISLISILFWPYFDVLKLKS